MTATVVRLDVGKMARAERLLGLAHRLRDAKNRLNRAASAAVESTLSHDVPPEDLGAYEAAVLAVEDAADRMGMMVTRGPRREVPSSAC